MSPPRTSRVLRSAALLLALATVPDAAQEARPWARVRAASVAGCGYLVLRDGEATWSDGRGVEAPPFEIEILGKASRSKDERVVVAHTGPGNVRVLQQPREENRWETVLLVPEPRVTWDGDDVWSFPHEAGATHEITVELVDARSFDAEREHPGELVREQREARSLARRGQLREACAAWREVALTCTSRELRALAREEHAWLHRDLAFELTEADRAKVAALHDEQVRATYGGEGAVRAGERVMLLWPEELLDHPSVPGFLADLDLAYAALVGLTGQDPFDVYGYRFCMFLMPSGAAWFDHHAGFGLEEFGRHPPFDTVVFHEMGHDFFKYPTSLIAPEPSWGEGAASFAQLRALDFLGFDRAGLARLWREGERRVAQHVARGAPPGELGPYFEGATTFSSFAVREEADGLLTWDWEACARMCRAFRDVAHAPRSTRDRYRHWAMTIAGVFGPDTIARLARLGVPVEPGDLQRVHVEREHVLPALAGARAARAAGDARAADEHLRRAAGIREHRLRGDVRLEELALARLHGDEHAEREAAEELGLLRHWWVHEAVPLPGGEVEARVLGTPWRARGAGGPLVARRALGASGTTALEAGRFLPHEVARTDGVLDLRALLAPDGSAGTTWAATVLRVAEARRVQLRLGQDDDLAVFLDGECLGRFPDFTSVHHDHRELELHLAEGEHLLVLEVGNRAGDWGLVARLSGPDGLGADGVETRFPDALPPAPPERTEVWRVGTPDGDHRELAWGGTDGWSERFGRDLALTLEEAGDGWSGIHPGPNDAWAGSSEHVFALTFDLERPHDQHLLVVHTVGSNGWTPPLLRVTVNGRSVEWRLPGSPDAVLEDPSLGTPVRLEVRLLPGLLRARDNRLELTIPDGSWVLYDALELVRLVE